MHVAFSFESCRDAYKWMEVRFDFDRAHGLKTWTSAGKKTGTKL